MRKILCAIVSLAMVIVYSTACTAETPTQFAPAPLASPIPRDTAMPSPSGNSKPAVGYLQGQVRVGPLRPVEQVGVPTPPIPPEVFTSRSLNIFQSDGTTLVTNVKFNNDGTYRVALALGIYVVSLARTGMDRARDLPKTINIESGKTVQLDIDIDTGMR